MTTSKFFLFVIGLSFSISACNEAGKNKASKESRPVHPRVIWTEKPQEHAIVSWTTLSSAQENKVYYDTISRAGSIEDYSFSTSAVKSGEITLKSRDIEEGVPEGWYHHAELTDLQASTTYYFVMESDGQATEEFHFISAPEQTDSIKLLAGGDSRLGGERPRYAGRTPHEERKAMKKLIGQLVEDDPQIMAFVHGADYGTTANWRHLYWYFEDLQLATTEQGRILPMIISMGNHDTQLGFIENFYLGSVNEYIAFGYYYVTELTEDLALITLNTEIDVTGLQHAWLQEKLPILQEKYHTTLVNYHKPAFPAAKDPDDFKYARIRQHWVPLFEAHDVHLAIESDGHCLKRTPPIKNNAVDPEGIVYIGEGGLGAPLREPDTTRWFLKGGYADKLTHVWLIDIAANETHLQAIEKDGNVVDEHTMRRKK